MNRYTQFALLSASTLRMLPHIALYLLHRKEIDADLEKYQDQRGGVVNFIKVCTRERVYRNLFYYRMGDYRSVFIKWLLPPESTLHIWCRVHAPHLVPGDWCWRPFRAQLRHLSERRAHRPRFLLSAERDFGQWPWWQADDRQRRKHLYRCHRVWWHHDRRQCRDRCRCRGAQRRAGRVHGGRQSCLHREKRRSESAYSPIAWRV